MGLLNSNASVISTMFGELSNLSNQSFLFSLMPIFWGLGAVIGPIIGGGLVYPVEKLPVLFGENELFKRFP
jgi:MFS family permease